MANLSLDGYLTPSKRKKKEKEEIERDLEQALYESSREINSYYRKGVDNVGSSRSDPVKFSFPSTAKRVTVEPQNNPGGYAVKPKTTESIERDLELALTETKRDLDTRTWSTGSNVPSRDAGSNLTNLSTQTTQKQNQSYGPNLPQIYGPKLAEDPYEKVKYELDEDDFIDKTYHKYTDYTNNTHRAKWFRTNSLESQYDDYYKTRGDTALNRESFFNAADTAIDVGKFVYNLVYGGIPAVIQYMIDDKSVAGPGDLGKSEFDLISLFLPKSKDQYKKQEIANYLLENTYYKYAANDSSIYGKKYQDELKQELSRLYKLPYSVERQKQIEKLKTVIYMNENPIQTRKQFRELVDLFYKTGRFDFD